MKKSNGPVLIELEEVGALTPQDAPLVPENDESPNGKAMHTVVELAALRPSLLLRWFWRLGLTLISFGVSVWVWSAVNELLVRNIYLGGIAIALAVLFSMVCLGLIIRELGAYARLRRLDHIRRAADLAISNNDLIRVNKVVDQLQSLYLHRSDLTWAGDRLKERREEILDADGLLELAESELLQPLDELAKAEIVNAARQVALATALVPLAFVDVLTALVANLRMIRRIAEIYGGRTGTFGGFRLARTVLTHLVATGAVAVGDDLIGSVAGGGVLSKFSRRFGEGIINGALTARVGVAAIEVCRPLSFRFISRPSVTGLVKQALAGLFSSK